MGTQLHLIVSGNFQDEAVSDSTCCFRRIFGHAS